MLIKKRLVSTCRIILSLMLLSFSLVSCVSIPEQKSTSIPEQTYSLKIEAEPGGTIPAGQEDVINGNYKKGAEIHIIAREMPGYHFVNWTSSNGGTFADEKNPETTFTMPDNNTIVTAHFAAS